MRRDDSKNLLKRENTYLVLGPHRNDLKTGRTSLIFHDQLLSKK